MSLPLIVLGAGLSVIVALVGIALVAAMYAAGIESSRNRKWEL